jgi:hypothetical protein
MSPWHAAEKKRSESEKWRKRSSRSVLSIPWVYAAMAGSSHFDSSATAG